MSDKQDKKKAKAKTFEMTDETQAQAESLLNDMLARVKARVPANHALALVKQNINIIDELNREGATITQIFGQLDKSLKLGISASSFVQYVRRIRKEIGSEMYVSREQSKSKATGNMEAAPAARAETDGAPVVQRETAAAAGWNCAECESKAERRESTKHPGNFFWRCSACGTNYRDENGELTSERAK